MTRIYNSVDKHIMLKDMKKDLALMYRLSAMVGTFGVCMFMVTIASIIVRAQPWFILGVIALNMYVSVNASKLYKERDELAKEIKATEERWMYGKN